MDSYIWQVNLYTHLEGHEEICIGSTPVINKLDPWLCVISAILCDRIAAMEGATNPSKFEFDFNDHSLNIHQILKY